MSKSLPYSMKDVDYNNAKFRQRSQFKCIKCSTGRFLVLLLFFGVTHRHVPSTLAKNFCIEQGANFSTDENGRFKKTWSSKTIPNPNNVDSGPNWKSRQQRVKESFIHALSGYQKHAMGYDELMPLTHKGIDGLGGLGATIVDALDTCLIMGIDEISHEAGSWIENHLLERINEKGQINLFETTIRVLGGLLSAYHLSGGKGNASTKGPNPAVYLENAKNLADHLLVAFTSSPTDIPFSDVVLRDRSAHTAPDGMCSTSEVSTLQLEFNYLSYLTGDPKYAVVSMKVLEHMKTLEKVCFLPGTLALGATKGILKEKAMRENMLNFEDLENLKLAEDLTKTCCVMYSVTSTGLAPEIAYFRVEGQEGGPSGGNKSSKHVDDIIIKPSDRHNLLRPETVESLLYMFRIMDDPKYREWGWEIFEAFEKYTKVDSGGYSSLNDVTVDPLSEWTR